MSRKEDKQMGPLSPSTGPNKDVAPRTSKAAAGTAAGATAGAGTGSMNPKLKGGKAKPKSVSRVNKASTSDVSYEQMKNYPCRRMKLKLKAAGQQLVYDDMCSLAKRQAAKRGFVFVGRNGTGPGVPSGEAVPDAMWPAGGGGAKLNAVIEKLERQIWQTYSDSDREDDAGTPAKKKKKRKKAHGSGTPVTTPSQTPRKGKSSAKENDNANDEYYDIEDSWIDDGSLDDYFEPCDEAEEYDGFYVNQREVVSHCIADGAEKKRVSSNNVLSKQKARMKPSVPSMAEMAVVSTKHDKVAVANKRKDAPRTGALAIESKKRGNNNQKKGKPAEALRGAAAAGPLDAAAASAENADEGKKNALSAKSQASSRATVQPKGASADGDDRGTAAASGGSSQEAAFQKYRALAAIMEKMQSAAERERERKKSNEEGGKAVKRNRCTRETSDLFRDIECELQAIEAKESGAPGGDTRSELRKSVVDELEILFDGILMRKSILSKLSECRMLMAEKPVEVIDIVDSDDAAVEITGEEFNQKGASRRERLFKAPPRCLTTGVPLLDEHDSGLQKRPKARSLAAPTMAPTDVKKK